MFQLVEPVMLDMEAVSTLCRTPYPRHPQGCPNYGYKSSCPPFTKPLFRHIQLRPVYAIWKVFDLAAHKERMRNLHQDWSEAQLLCCLYWQGKARKELLQEIKRFQARTPGKWKHFTTPEAHGVNVTLTMQQVGVFLEWPPRSKTVLVAIAGRPKAASL